MIDVVCAIIANNEGRILVTQRSSQMNHPLKWEFPGGKVESNETPEQSVIREIREELSVEIEIEKFLGFNLHSYPHMDIRLVGFVCTIKEGKIKLKEHAARKWVAISELIDLDWVVADIAVLNKYLSTI